MKIPKIKKCVKIKINYKSGISETFLCSEFQLKGRDISWEAYASYYPVDIAFSSSDDIESIWAGSTYRIVLE
jgi:hypothetical protein